MLGARRLPVALFATIWIVSACGGGVPAGQTAPTVALVPGASTAPAAAPTAASTLPRPSLASGPAPTTPSAQQTPAPTPLVPRPNLIISEFFVEEDPVVVGRPATLVATVANSGTLDAGRFTVEIVRSEPNQPDVVLDTATYSGGLAVGRSSELTVTINPDAAGDLRLIARVDVTDEVVEADESDNEQVLEITARLLANLTFPANGLRVTPLAGAQPPGVHLFEFTLANTGSVAIDDTVTIKFFAYTSDGQYVEWGTHDLDITLAPGETTTLQVAYQVNPGSYRAYALIDSDETLDETDEGDNQAFFDFTAP